MADRDVKEILPHHIDSGTATTGQALFPDGSGGHENRSIAESDVVNLVTDLASKVAKAGDTMTGALTIDVTSGTIQTWKIAGVVKAVIDGSGNLIIGTDPGGSEKLRVGGGIRATSVSTIDLGTGSLPAVIGSPNLILSNADATANRMQVISFGIPSCFILDGRNIGGTRAANAATAANARFFSFGGFGHDGSALVTTANAILYAFAPTLWSGTSRETAFSFTGTPNGSTTATEWMRLQNASLIIGTDPGGSEKLMVGGDIRATNATLSGAINQTGGQYHYLRGDASTDGSVRFSSPSSGVMTVESRISGTWTEIGRFG